MFRSALAIVTALVLVFGTRGSASNDVTTAAQAVESIGMTVSNLDRSVAFFRSVLSFTVEREYESAGRDLELLTGVFGARTRRRG